MHIKARNYSGLFLLRELVAFYVLHIPFRLRESYKQKNSPKIEEFDYYIVL